GPARQAGHRGTGAVAVRDLHRCVRLVRAAPTDSHTCAWRRDCFPRGEGGLMRKAYLLVSLLPLACGQSGPSSPGQVRGAMVVLHTRTNILTAPAGNWSADSPLRARVEASFPSACVDLDDDDDGVPNVVDVDHVDDAADVVEDQCHRCNRGPG